MPAEIPYMLSQGGIKKIFAKIQSAGTPPKFTHEFLKTTLGFSSSNDRAIIKVLRQLGFVDTDSKPTARYNDFRNEHKSGASMAAGLREGWADVFLADEKLYEKKASDLIPIFKSVTGKGDSVAEKMAQTFRQLADLATWTGTPAASSTREEEQSQQGEVDGKDDAKVDTAVLLGGSVALHHDVHIHLPPTSDVAVYTAIFRALREELLA